jgi:hypothetical protein
MSDSLFQVTAIGLVSWLYAFGTYKAALFLQGLRRFEKTSRLADVLGVSRRNLDVWSWLAAIYSGLGLIPAFPIVMTIILRRTGGELFFYWRGWAAVSIVGSISFVIGLYQGSVYLATYWRALRAFDEGEVTLSRSDLPSRFPTSPVDVIYPIAFRGVEAWYAVRAAKGILAERD